MSPGPWRWRPVTLASPPSDWRVVVLEDAGQIEVARLEPGAIRDQADARLIAAAPEMFALLNDGDRNQKWCDSVMALLGRIAGDR